MKKTLVSVLVLAVVSAAALPASAQAWMSINDRQARLDQRIDAGVRQGDLTRAEAFRLRAEFTDLARLERDYRISGGGLTARERVDLDRRFDGLSTRIRYDRNDAQAPGAWVSINQRQANLERRIDRGVQRGQLTRRETVRLQSEFAALKTLELDYRRSGRGLDVRERAELDRRFNALSLRIRDQRNDRQQY